MRRYIPELDGLRAFAILPVMLGHLAFFTPLPGVLSRYGGLGVDLFFVLSGYLISGILLSTRGTENYYRNFFARRGLRIWPLYFAVVAASLVLAAPARSWPYVLYVSNITERTYPWTLAVTWSLCIEEQFYLAWPLLVSVCSRRAFRILLMAIIVGDPVLRWVLFSNGVDSWTVYTGTATRLDGLALGSLIALLSESRREEFKHMLWGGILGSVAVIEFLVSRSNLLLRESLFYSAVSLVFAAVLCVVLGTRPSRILSLRPLTWIGRVSYGLYIFHYPVFYIIAKYIRPGVALIATQVVAAFAIAFLSWTFFESPILKLKRHFEQATADIPVSQPIEASAATARS